MPSQSLPAMIYQKTEKHANLRTEIIKTIKLKFITFAPLFSFHEHSMADWVILKKTSLGAVYINDENIQKNKENEIFFELLRDYKVKQEGIDRVINGQRIYDTHFKPHSTKTAMLIHCHERKASILGSMYFPERMAAGKKLFSEVTSEPIWISDRELDLDEIHPIVIQSSMQH